MHSSLPESDDLGKALFSGAVLAGSLVASFIVFFMAIWGPEQLMAQPLGIIFWVTGLALTVAILNALGDLLRIPLLTRGIILIVSQWLGLWGRIWIATQTIPPFVFNPLPLIKSNWLWCLLIAVIWGSIISLQRILARLSRVPQKLTFTSDSSNSDLNDNLILIQWRKDWSTWRWVIISLIFISVLFFGVQFPVMRASTVLRKIMIGLFFIEVATGWLLLAIGFFYFKRACWKVDGVEPGIGFKTIWYRWLAILFGGMALFCGIVPADFGRHDEWWARLLTLISKSTTGPVPAPEVPTPIDWVEKGMTQYMNLNQSGQLTKLVIKIALIIALVIPLIAVIICIIVLAGYLCSKLYPSLARELDQIKGLPKTLIKLYLYWVNLWRGWRSRIKSGSRIKRGDSDTDFPDGSQPEEKNKRYSWGRGPQAVIRRGYYRTVEQARSHGLQWEPSHTTQDIASGLNELLPEEAKAINEITFNYQQARYGSSEPPLEKVRLFERLRRGLERQLRLLIK